MAISVLVVDDEEDLELMFLQKFRKKIKSKEYIFCFARDGAEALTVLGDFEPDVILTDINMPVMDGLALLANLKEKELAQRSIVVTAYTDMKNIRAAMNLGAFDFLTKPIDFADLEITIQNVYQNTLRQKENFRNRKEIEMARKIQIALLPAEPPEIKELKIAWDYKPMLDVGGDFFDLIYQEEDGLLGFFICDVSGHGIPAAFLACMVKMSLRSWSGFITSPSANLNLAKSSLDGKMAGNALTACVGYINTRTGELAFARAGHLPLIKIDSQGNVETYQPGGRLLTDVSFIDIDAEEEELVLKKGDKILLYTDGITEATDGGGRLFGEQNFLKLLEKHGRESPEALCSIIDEEIQKFIEGHDQEDDVTLLVIEYDGS